MLIVPDPDRLVVEVKIPSQDIDSVRVGQTAMLRFAAFNTRTTPEISGTVTRISADVTQDAKTGVSYHTARISPRADASGRFGDARLVPGMPVECHLQIGERSLLSYLTKPLHDQLIKA